MLVLFVLITLIFALLGMTLFGGSFGSYAPGEPPAELPRTHFDYIGPAMLSTLTLTHPNPNPTPNPNPNPNADHEG